ncbi:MAG: hypothetical protein E6Q83_13215 [Thiothrix sp.]|nr:MAG: hypothetical protein E6Q83_13215 [Thiothrix sp.]
MNDFANAKDFLLLADSSQRLGLINTLKQSIAPFSYQSGDQRFLLSSPYLQSEILEVHELHVLQASLAQIGFSQVKVIIYLRDQIGLASALFSQLVRQGAGISSLPFPEDSSSYGKYFKQICDHRSTLERFAAVFGEENLIVRLFHPQILKNKSVLEDFLDIFSLAWSEAFVIPKADTKAFAKPGPELLGRVNQKIPPSPSLARVKLRELIMESFEQLFTAQAYEFSSELFQAYLAAYAEPNEWVRKNFFPKRSQLFPSRAMPEKTTRDLSEQELDNIANMLADLWLEQEKT